MTTAQVALVSRRELRRTPLELMTDEQLTAYILNFWDGYPLTKEELASYMMEMKACVRMGRAMSMTPRERAQYLKHKEENRKKKEAYEREASKPKLHTMVI